MSDRNWRKTTLRVGSEKRVSWRFFEGRGVALVCNSSSKRFENGALPVSSRRIIGSFGRNLSRFCGMIPCFNGNVSRFYSGVRIAGW